MPILSPSLIIMSCLEDIYATNILKKEKKSQKSKIPNISSIKKVVAKAKRLVVNDFVDNFANIVSFIFF